MKQLTIQKPVTLIFSLAEQEEQLPSLKFDVHGEMTEPSCTTSFHAKETWFETSQWEVFADQLCRINETGGSASLGSLSEEFRLQVEAKNLEIFFLLSYVNKSGTGNVQEIKFHCRIDLDTLDHLKYRFSEFGIGGSTCD